jgi:hypothetical protein
MIPLMIFLLAAGEQSAAQIAPMKIPAGAVRTTDRVSVSSMNALEKRFNERLTTLFEVNDQLDLLGNTRGVYLEGYGAVFTAEVSLVVTPSITPFRARITKETAEAIRQKKIQRLPFLQAAMKEMVRNMGATFIQVPEDRQMVLVVRFYYEPWEDMNGLPSQIVMKANRTNAMKGDVQMEVQ